MEIPEELKEMMTGYLKSAQNALVNISSEITKIKNAKEAQLKQMDDALTYYTEQKVKIQADIDKLLEYGLVVPEDPKPEPADTTADDTATDKPVEAEKATEPEQ